MNYTLSIYKINQSPLSYAQFFNKEEVERYLDRLIMYLDTVHNLYSWHYDVSKTEGNIELPAESLNEILKKLES